VLNAEDAELESGKSEIQAGNESIVRGNNVGSPEEYVKPEPLAPPNKKLPIFEPKNQGPHWGGGNPFAGIPTVEEPETPEPPASALWHSIMEWLRV
jgi:hypothetical protein